MTLGERDWVPRPTASLVRHIAARTAMADIKSTRDELVRLVLLNHQIHDVECVNLNPATNVMNPRAEAMLASGLGSRASLGYPADKYEFGLDAIEQIEIIAAALAAETFDARYAEVRVSSGALANLYVFMATCSPGDVVIAPPAELGGHVTHHAEGAAGLYGVRTISAPVSASGYTVDVVALKELAHRVSPRLITLGGSLNLFPHPVSAVREIADAVGATLMFDAAHVSGMLAGRVWPQPLTEGAHVMTMSTYKSLGGPPGGLVVTNDADLAERIEAIAYPGLTANFDAGRVAALAVSLLDWKACGSAYASTMQATAAALSDELLRLDVPVFSVPAGATSSHQFAIRAESFGGGQAAAGRLREANLLASGIGLPTADVVGDFNGLRIGTPEIVRLGMGISDMPTLASFIARGLDSAVATAGVAKDVTEWRSQFTGVHFVAD
ncbi:beta-eliminating lyase-related protein [Jatrophihabitans sp. DSM 45814]